MSSKPLLFHTQHRSWQLKINNERRKQLDFNNEDFYETKQKLLPS